jgi:Fic family protein
VAVTGDAASTPPRFTRTPHLVDLVAEAERLATALGRAPGPASDALAARTADRAVLASLRLDGSTLEELPSMEQLDDAIGRGPAPPPDARPGTWLDAMGTIRGDADRTVQALETLGVRTALTADDLDEQLFTAPEATLAELHRRLTRGLVDPAYAGVPRRSEQAVHDASVGRILYFTVDPEAVPRELALLGAWLASAGTREHGVIVSGIVHLELLRIHPFEAANGRLARAAARSALRARGLDPLGLAAPEIPLADDPLGYHEEVARTLRRRDATIWLERWAETVTEGLRAAARSLELLSASTPARALTFLAGRDDPAFTLADYRADAEVGPEDARADLRSLLEAGRIARVPGSRGLRFVVSH